MLVARTVFPDGIRATALVARIISGADVHGSQSFPGWNPGYRLCVACCPIVQEILQGIKQEEKFAKLKDSMLAMKNTQESIGVDDFLAAADIYRVGRKRGLKIRSSMDCLIASLAIKHKVPVWHNDRDFDYIAKFSH